MNKRFFRIILTTFVSVFILLRLSSASSDFTAVGSAAELVSYPRNQGPVNIIAPALLSFLSNVTKTQVIVSSSDVGTINLDALSQITAGKVLNVPYLDQVFYQKKLIDGYWIYCGPSSVTMLMNYYRKIDGDPFTIRNPTDVFFEPNAIDVIKDSVMCTTSNQTCWPRLVAYLNSKGVVTSNETHSATPLTYEKIKTGIDNNVPVIMGLSIGHIVIVVGYRDPNIVIVNDPFGGRYWWLNSDQRNDQPGWTSGPTPKVKGQFIEYTINEITNIGIGNWANVSSAPAISSAYSWDFEDINAPIWADYQSNSLENMPNRNNGANYRITGSDPYFRGRFFQVNAGQFPYILLTMASRLDNIGQIYFQPVTHGVAQWDDEHMVTYALNSNGTRNYTSIDMSKNLNWKDMIWRLRVDPALSVPPLTADNQQVTIGSIAFSKHEPSLNLLPGKVADSKAELIAWHSGKCLDVKDWAINDGTLIQQWECHDGLNQVFYLNSVGDYYQIRSAHSNKCLDIQNGSINNGTLIQQWTCDSTNNNQLWKLQFVSSNAFFIQPKLDPGKCLDVRDKSVENAASLQLWGCWGGTNQTFAYYTKCPTSVSSGAVLYKGAYLSCEGLDEQGYVTFTAPGTYDVGLNVSSIRLADNYVATLYPRDANFSPKRIPANRLDFAQIKFTRQQCSIFESCEMPVKGNIGRIKIEAIASCGAITSSAQGTCPIPNLPPTTPILSEPADNSINRGHAPTLKWTVSTDPDNDSFEYQIEVTYGLNVITSSTSATSWYPTQLDNLPGIYQWRVRARDALGATSAWSASRNFTILPPNQPPVVSFNAANGQDFPAGVVFSRDRNWTFSGTASDYEQHLNRVEFQCAGDGCGDVGSHAGAAAWTHTQNNLAGENDISFVGYDDEGLSAVSRHLILRIDLNSPSTQVASLNNLTNPAQWPQWFTKPVQVNLSAIDGSTGRAMSGVREIHYRTDGGAWQVIAGGQGVFVTNTDGAHVVDYYAVDNVGNEESVHTVSFQVDQTAPILPNMASETNGVLNDQWQKLRNIPTFTWAMATDNGSGLYGYNLYFGTDPNGQAFDPVLDNEPRQWTPMPGGVHTGVYYLRGRARDNAGNWSQWLTLFTFRYDGTPPENPAVVSHTLGITSTVWQNITNRPDFTWLEPHDEGSGLKGYTLYWGAGSVGISTDTLTVTHFQSTTALCADNSACTGYLRLRSVDNADNQAVEWSTAFVLRYDNAPPVSTFSVNGGVTQTAQTQVLIDMAATDEGSGVQAMRFSPDGQTWTPWEVYAQQKPWQIAAISRQSWPIYAQVRDNVGLESPVFSRTVYLDVNSPLPRSTNFRLFDHALSAGAGVYTSSVYSGRGTLGQVLDSAAITSSNYILNGGYEIGSQAIPLIVPGHDEFNFLNGIFASGARATILTSTLYRARGVFGEFGLPNVTTITSTNYSHQPGFLAAAPPTTTIVLPTPESGPAPTPDPALLCETPSIVINDNAPFTDNPHVNLTLCAPRAVEMKVSDRDDFVGAEWEPYAISRTWTLTFTGQLVEPRFVYVIYKNADNTEHGTYFDDILYDPVQPTGSVQIGDGQPISLPVPNNSGFFTSPGSVIRPDFIAEGMSALEMVSSESSGAVDLFITGHDDNSGVVEMQISEQPNSDINLGWNAFAAQTSYTSMTGDGLKTIYVRLRDDAGNISNVTVANYLLDTLAPVGYAYFEPEVVGTEAFTVTLHLNAYDELSGVNSMRIGLDPEFTDALWMPYTPTLTQYVSPTATTMYIQYRDLAGNISGIYEAKYTVDATPPIVQVYVSGSDTLTQSLTIAAYDESGLQTMRVSNDPMMAENVVSVPYQSQIEWEFDERLTAWVQVEDRVGNLSEPFPAYAGGINRQAMLLQPQWNLVSFLVEPLASSITKTLNSIAGRYDQVLGENGAYASALPPEFNSLQGLHAGQAYYVRVTGGISTNLLLEGWPKSSSMPIPLHAGWNWLGYYPTTALPITDALQSIAGHYQRVLSLDATFEPALPQFSTLQTMQPGEGYLLYANDSVTLTYPSGTGALMHETTVSSAACGDVSPTPRLTIFYGSLYVGGQPAPVGTRVEAVTPRGEVAGCTIVRTAGSFGFMHIYGADDVLAGFKAGEPLTWRVNGESVLTDAPLTWQDDKVLHVIALGASQHYLYLPITLRY